MSSPRLSPSRTRFSLQAICKKYLDEKNPDKAPLEKIVRAFRGIQKLDPTDDNSFFKIAGYHGEPFRGAGWGNSQWWGGYCNHGNVLFPTWHRAYCLRLEDALRSIEGCEDVTLPFWDEAIADPGQGVLYNPVPWVCTQKTFRLPEDAQDGESPHNPLYSYIFQAGVYDNVTGFGKDNSYTKGPGYETVRYPLSGLVGSDADIANSKAHNQQYEAQAEEYLNGNVRAWLNRQVKLDTGKTLTTGIREKFFRCLEAPNYTVFSNTTSAMQWNEDNFGTNQWAPDGIKNRAVVPLESPHNSMHLAVGGFEMPDPNGGIDSDNVITGANGDMGENDTAGFDPIFFFHHAFIDRVFWLWQTKTEATKTLDIIHRYPGTNSVDNQGPTPGTPGNVWLTMDTPLEPFVKSDGSPLSSKDVVDIEGQLGYNYGPGSLESGTLHDPMPQGPVLRVTNINRAQIPGSFAIHVYAPVGVDKHYELVNIEAVLSRREIQGCANCQTHLNVKLHMPVYGLGETVDSKDVVVKMWTRDGYAKDDQFGGAAARMQSLVIQDRPATGV